MQYKRNHPVFILEGVYKLIPLLIFPLLRGFVSALKGGLYEWLSGAWMDISVVLVIAALAILRWRLTQYAFDGENISLKGGLFTYQEKTVPIDKICSVTCETPWFFRPFSATRIRIDTLSGTDRRADISLTLSSSTALNIMAVTNQRINSEKISMQKTFSPRFLYIMIVSAFLSDSFAGAGFAAALVSRAGALVGEELENRVVGTLNNIVRLLSFGIPPVLSIIAIVILGGWLIGFVQNLVRHQGLTLCRSNKTLLVKGGKITPRTTLIRVSDINFINIKQGLFTKLLGVYTVFGHCVGVGKKKEDITTITPAGNKQEIDESFAVLFPEFERAKITLRPNFLALFRFIADPLWPCILLPIATSVLIKYIPTWNELLFFVGFMACIPAYWWLLIRLVDFATSGIGTNENSVTLKYSKLLQLNTAVIPWEKIVSVKLRQSPLQRLDKKCDVFVYTKGEKPYRHRVRNVDTETARKILRIK